MSTRSLSVQQESGGLQSSEETAPEPGPALSAPAPVLWAGFAVCVVIFVVVLLVTIRGRVLRPAARRAKARTDFFEPAGDDAEITFDDDAPQSSQDADAREPEGAVSRPETEFEPETMPALHDEPLQNQKPAEPPTEPEAAPDQSPPLNGKPRRAPFASLFSKKPKARTTPTPDNGSYQIEDELFNDGAGPDTAPIPNNETLQPEDPASLPAQLRVMRDDVEARRREAEESELRRLEAAEEAEEEARRRRRMEQYAAAPPPITNAQTIAAPARQELEALKEELEQSFATRIEALSSDIGAHLDLLAARTIAPQSAPQETHSVSEAHFAEFADLLGEQMHALRESSASSIAALSERIDNLDTSTDGLSELTEQINTLSARIGEPKATTLSGRIQLADILASVLPPSRYTLGDRLSSGKSVDAIVKIAGSDTPIAIDARFPIEAFDEYQRRRNSPEEASAETAFRRALLRHLVDIAEKQIILGETAGAAMMFAPSEHILTTLHAVFADLVQESYRARVWIVSPTTLAAAVHTISAINAASPKPQKPVKPNTEKATTTNGDGNNGEAKSVQSSVSKELFKTLKETPPTDDDGDHTTAPMR